MKKFISVLLICVVFVFAFAGCGVSTNPNDPNAEIATPKPTPTPTPTPQKSLPPVPSPSKLTIREDANGWRYSVEDGKMTVYGYQGSELSVTIPSEIVDEQGVAHPVEVLDANALCAYGRIIVGDSRYSCDLEEVVIPDFINEVPIELFEQCNNLKNVSWKGFKIVNNVVFSSDMTTLYYCLNRDITSYVIPSSVTTVAGGAFRNCTKLTKIDIPGTVKTVGNYAFFGCDLLTSVVVEDGVEALGTQLFTKCAKLKSIMIPESVVSIGYYLCTLSDNLKIYIKEGSPADEIFKTIAEDRMYAEADTYINYVVYAD